MPDDLGLSSDEEEVAVDPIVKEHFKQAVQKIQNETVKGNQLASHVMLTIYGLYKAATVGKCKDPKPGILDQKGRTKWSAWTKVSDLSKSEAMGKYVQVVKENYSWKPEEVGACSLSKTSSSSVMGGNTVSSFAMSPDDPGDGKSESSEFAEVFSWVKDNKVDELVKWLESGDPNLKDCEGLTLLHWGVDRGHIDICRVLLSHGADPNIPDSDGDTALDYAVTCDHADIVKLLRDPCAAFGED